MTDPQKPINRGAKETVVDGLTGASGVKDTVAEGATPAAADMSNAAKESGAAAIEALKASGDQIETPIVPEQPTPREPAAAGTAAEPMVAAATPAAAQPIARYDADAPVHRVAADSRGRILAESDFKKLSRRSLLTGAGGAVAAFVGWRTLQGRPESGNIPDVLRTGHELNESIWRTAFRSKAESPTFDFAESSMMRVNGRHGIRDDLNLATWELRIVGRDGELLGTHGVDDLRALPQTEMTVEHKCVEGWSHVVTWGGVVFSTFLETFYPEQADAKFVGLSTPDGDFNVGLEMDAMLHSQTMLTLDLQREPLDEEHGAPVRLTTPLKYGTKNIKRIGTLAFSDTQPENDYWTVRGYDWYAAL